MPRIRSGGMIAVIAGKRTSWRCMFCRTAEQPKIDASNLLYAVDDWRQHLTDQHPDLLPDT